jgi:hypothetical protein
MRDWGIRWGAEAMARYYGKRWSGYHDDYFDWSEYHQTQRDEISEMYGGADRDVERFFFDLDEQTLKSIFREYKERHGSGKTRYARQAFEKWKSGEVQMSGEVAERLLEIVPKYLSFDQRYLLIDRLYRNAPPRNIRVDIPIDVGYSCAVRMLLYELEKISPQLIHEDVQLRLTWLTEADAQASQSLLQHIFFQERIDRIKSLEPYLARVGHLMRVAKESSTNATSSIAVEMPGILLTISVATTVSSPRPVGQITMSSDENTPNAPNTPSELKPHVDAGELAEIRSAEQLLNDAIKHISPEKRQELVDKAAEEAVRLQVKRAEFEVDSEAQERMIDRAQRVVRANAVNPGNEIGYQEEVEGAHVSVTKPQGYCFVATACFGNYDHPAVRELRDFRDNYLMHSSWGCRFVGWYYRVGPYLAQLVVTLPGARMASRSILSALCMLLRIR